MPRPTEQEPKNTEGCWARKSRLEKILIPVTAVTVLIIIVLLFFVAKREVDFALKYCNTTTCIIEASKITSYVDSEVNPCDDFYQFACGNFLKNAHGDEKLALPELLQDQAKRELFEAYIEPIKKNDHKMVKAAKNLFRACMNETEIENDDLRTIKEAVKALGGWPVVEGSEWIEGTFDWATTSSKLRELGYHYSVFLDLTIEDDPDDSTKYIYKIATPDMWDYSSRNFDKVEFMTEVAKLFGAEDNKAASAEMAEANEFLNQLQMEVHNRYGLGTQSKYRVRKYQQKCGNLNWLEFINNIASPPAEISEDDYVLFPPPDTLKSWIDLISKTPKRTQANYMIWKVIEAALPFLTEDLRNLDKSRRKQPTREKFCLREIQERFSPSPIDIIYDRRYLPKEKKAKVEEISQNIKSELIDGLENVKWLNKSEKEEVLKRAKAIEIVIGQPGNYFGDEILDDLDVDMVSTKNNAFLTLIAQANRNRQTTLYQRINNNKSATENLYQKWIFNSGTGLPFYSEEDDMIYIPAVSVSDLVYNETKPNYLNYGILGALVAQQFSGVLNRYLREEGHEKRKCMEKGMEDYELKFDRFQIDFVIYASIGEQISYTAYEKWVKNHKEEQHLITIKYTPKQLFWISTAFAFCQPISSYGALHKSFYNPKLFSSMVSGIVRNNPQFAKDFDCPKGSKMNPTNRCSLV